MGSKQCCCGGDGPPGTCCDSGCECWADVYTATVPGFVMGQSENCGCCAACLGDGTCCHQAVLGEGCVVEADPTEHVCCRVFDWLVSGGSIKLYRTGSDACKNPPLGRDCTDPWSPMTKTVQDTEPGCNTYETDYGLVGSTMTYPCPDNPDPDYMTVRVIREVYGDSCQDCGNPGWGNEFPQLIDIETNIPVRARFTCCGDAGTSKTGCEPCPDGSLPGSGVTHYLFIEPLAAISYQWTVFTGGGATGYQQVTQAFMPPTLAFARRLSCSSTPAGAWRFLGTGGACGSDFGWSGICPCDDRVQDPCVTNCQEQEGSLCNCEWDPPPPCQGDLECPACGGQDSPTFGDITLTEVE